jgi:hypothetical protein
MLKNNCQNIHRSKLPPPGAVGRIVGLSTVNPHHKCIVSYYPLCDSADYRYSIGIYTVWVRFLDTSQIARFSAIWFQCDIV